MALAVFADSAADVVTDAAGNIKSGIDLSVWSATDGIRVTALYSLDGDPLPNVVTTDAKGRYRFQAESQDWKVLWMKDPEGNFWRVQAATVFDDVAAAGSLSRLADEKATEALSLASALGQTSQSLAEYATDEQLDGRADAAPALQTAIDSLPEYGRLTVPPGCTLWIEGPKVVELKSGVELDLRGATITKTSDYGYYTVFAANTGVTDVTIRNGYFRGKLSTGGNICVLAANRSSNILIENCQFDGCQGGGHTFDLCGTDGVTFRDCIWRGFDSGVSNTEHCETIECDVSYQGTVSYADPAGYDGTVARNVLLDNCRFLPYKDPDTGTVYPSPIPIGAHTYAEGQWYENITLRGVTVVDPWPDAPAGGILQNDAIMTGLVHFASVKGLRIDGMTVTSRSGNGSVRSVMVASRTSGIPKSTDYSAVIPQAKFATPQGSSDIKISGLTVNGMGGTVSTLNPIVVMCGWEADITDVKVDMSADQNYRQGVQLAGVKGASVNANMQNTASVGVRLVKCERVAVTGNFKECAYAVSVDGSSYISVGPLTAHKTGTASTGVVLHQNTTGSAHYVVITGVMAVGYTNIFYGPSLSTMTQAGNSPSTVASP